MTRRALIALLLMAVMLAGILCALPMEDIKKATGPPNRQTLYRTDDNDPSTICSTIIYNTSKYVVKSFPSVTIIPSTDLIVWVWSRGAKDATWGTDIAVTVGNMANNSGSTFTGATETKYIQIHTDTSDVRWFKLRFYDADSFLQSGKRVGVKIFGSGNWDYCTFGFDTSAETDNAQTWFYTSGSLVNESGRYTLFARLETVSVSPICTDIDNRQIQLSASISLSSSYYNNTNHYRASKWQLNDGLTESNLGGGGSRGYATNNHTYNRGSYINLTFKNRTIIMFGDSVMAGHPRHNINPDVYGAADMFNESPSYLLGLNLNQFILCEAKPSHTTAQLKARFESDVLAYRPDYVIIHGGANDIGYYHSHSAPIIANLTEMITKATANHTKVILFTLTPCGIWFDAEQRNTWNETNTWIRAQASDYVRIVDIAAALAGSTSWTLKSSYDYGDGIHWNTWGNGVVANETFEHGFNSVQSSMQNYTISKLAFWSHLAEGKYIGKIGTVNMTYRGGSQIITLDARETKCFNFTMSAITTDFLNFSIDSYRRTGMYAPTIAYMGELAVYGCANAGTASPTSGTSPLNVSFTYSASGGTEPYTYAWDFGDGTTSTSQNPIHAYAAAGNYTVKVTVTDSASHIGNWTTSITVTAPSTPSPPVSTGTLDMLAISLLTGAIIAVAAIGAFFVLKKRKKIGV